MQADDELDDVAAGAAAEALEPFRHAAYGQGWRAVVVEWATAHVPLTAGVELDAGGRDDLLDGVRGPQRGDVDSVLAGGGHGSIPIPTQPTSGVTATCRSATSAAKRWADMWRSVAKAVARAWSTAASVT